MEMRGRPGNVTHTPVPCNPHRTKTARIWNNAVKRPHGYVKPITLDSSPRAPNFQVPWGNKVNFQIPYTGTYYDLPYCNPDSYIILCLCGITHTFVRIMETDYSF